MHTVTWYGLALAFSCVGCATKPIIDSVTPGSIAVRYDRLLVSGAEATATAQKHCDKYGKNSHVNAANGGGRLGKYAVSLQVS